MPAPGFLDTPIEFLKGVGPQRGELLVKELGIATFGDLLQHFPFRYVDRSRFHSVRDVSVDLPYVQLRGVLSGLRSVGERQGRRLTAKLSDATGSIDLVWFKGIRWLQGSLKDGQEYIVFGKVSDFRGHLNMAHPELESAAVWEAGLDAALQPVYRTTEKAAARGLTGRGIGKLTKALLTHPELHLPETLSADLVQWTGGMSRDAAFRQVHAPQDQRKLDAAIRRLKFEELFFIQMHLVMQKRLMQQEVKGHVFDQVGELLQQLLQRASALRTDQRTEACGEGGAPRHGLRQADEPLGAGRCRQRQDTGRPAQHVDRIGQWFSGGVDGADGDPCPAASTER